jgi:hypothetical protein
MVIGYTFRVGYIYRADCTVKICIDFCAMGPGAAFGYALWAIVQNQ